MVKRAIMQITVGIETCRGIAEATSAGDLEVGAAVTTDRTLSKSYLLLFFPPHFSSDDYILHL